MKSTILSTKKLSLAQQELLLNSGTNYVAYDAVKINFLDFKITREVENYIFTSQNAVHSFLKKTRLKKPVFCVGDKTKLLLETKGFTVVETASNSLILAKKIVENYKNSSFLHFTGNLRRQELPDYLIKNTVKYFETKAYESLLIEKQFKQHFDGLLFFSPSGVQSFTTQNKINDAIAFCIGKTTATEAQKHTKNIKIANKPSVENVIVQAIKYTTQDKEC